MTQIIHRFKDGSDDPAAKVVPAKIINRLEDILAEAKKKQATA